jgi:hypothetical protein
MFASPSDENLLFKLINQITIIENADDPEISIHFTGWN